MFSLVRPLSGFDEGTGGCGCKNSMISPSMIRRLEERANLAFVVTDGMIMAPYRRTGSAEYGNVEKESLSILSCDQLHVLHSVHWCASIAECTRAGRSPEMAAKPGKSIDGTSGLDGTNDD